MSFILKALKKLENEKTARKAAPVEIDSAILAPDRSAFTSRRKGGRWMIIPLALLVGGGIIFLLLHKTPPPVTETRKTAPEPAPIPQAAPLSQTIKPEAERAGQEGATLNPPFEQVTPPRQKEPAKRPQRARAQNDFAPPSESGRQGSSVAAPPALTVNGIALQDDPAESMAVVNGALVKSGMTVGGAVVDRIYMDRVRFKGNGGTFEVYISK